MIRYTAISLVELLDAISKDETDVVYFERANGELSKASKYAWHLNEIKKVKWFKREVIE